MKSLLPFIGALFIAATSFGATVIETVPPGTDIGKMTLKANTCYNCAGAVTQSAGITLPSGTCFNGQFTGTLTISPSVSLAFNCIYPQSGVMNFKLITGSTGTVLISAGSKGGADGCFFTHNTTADGWNLCFQTVGGAPNFNFADNTIGVCNNYAVYVVDDNFTCTFNTFRGSLGQYIIRLTNNGGTTPGPTGARIVGNTLDQRINKFGKQAFGARMANNWAFAENIIYGSTRIGEVDATNTTQWCDGFSFTNNTFMETATESSPATNAIAVLSGSTGNISGNTFQPAADTVSPIAIAANNAITVTGNIQQMTTGQTLMPLMPSSSVPASYHSKDNTVVVVPAK